MGTKFQIKRSVSKKCKSKLSQKHLPEIFLIWTNVARTNVDWTNITIKFGIS